MLEIIAVRNEHLDQVIEHLQQISTFVPKFSDETNFWREYTEQSHVFTLVAIDENLVIGFGSLSTELKIRGGRIGHIEDIVVAPNKKNLGIGRIIVKELLKIAALKECYKVSLESRDHTTGFYTGLGFKKTGTTMQIYLPGE